jgi:CGNR zinc finger
MQPVSRTSTTWLLRLVNGYTPAVRQVAGEADQPHPTLEPLELPLPDRDDLTSIAEAHWQVFAESEPTRRAALLTELLEHSQLSPLITPAGQLEWTTRRQETAGRLAAACTVTLAEIVQDLGWDRIGICGGSDCIDAFVDEGGRSHRIYCSTTCLNRAKIRAYRARLNA